MTELYIHADRLDLAAGLGLLMDEGSELQMRIYDAMKKYEDGHDDGLDDLEHVTALAVVRYLVKKGSNDSNVRWVSERWVKAFVESKP